MSNTHHTTASNAGLTVTVYRGDGSALLGFDLDKHLTQNFAGFAVRMTAPVASPEYLKNRLSFDTPVAPESSPEQRQAAWTDSNLAPFQRFRWQHFPVAVTAGMYRYEVTAMYFSGKADSTDLKPGPTVDASISLVPSEDVDLQIGFTRSFVSSQAYAEQFGNKELRPRKTLDYSTAPYEKQYEFLGYTARTLIFDFLKECVEDTTISVDAFVYDIDEPDIVAALETLGDRLRIFMDDASLHTGATALEPRVMKRLQTSAGDENVKHGHFSRFAHDKVFVQRKGGKPVKVLTGSANFSIRGLYVQANNVLVYDDPGTAGLYGAVFDQVWADPTTKGFEASPLSKDWSPLLTKAGLPPFQVCFSPHKDAAVSMKKVADAIDGAKSSVLFAVMELGGGGPVLEKLRSKSANPDVFTYGVTQNVAAPKGKGADAENTKSVTVHSPSHGDGVIVPFAFISQNVPLPFRKEVNGGPGQVIHNKFVVVDFNGPNPVVFTGSSNLAEGGEQANGDNLIAIYDRSIAILYGVQAISLVDHFGFRAALKTASKPLTLHLNRDNWWQAYYDPKNPKYTERLLFVK